MYLALRRLGVFAEILIKLRSSPLGVTLCTEPSPSFLPGKDSWRMRIRSKQRRNREVVGERSERRLKALAVMED
jgi:hypothetical protein